MTKEKEKKEKGSRRKPVVNLMLIDPYLKQETFVLFKSTKKWEQKNDEVRQDEIKNSIIYSTKGSDGV